MKAAEKGDARLMQALLDNGADMTLQDRQGQTALMHAAAKGNTEAVQALLGHSGLGRTAREELVELKDQAGKTAAQHAEDNDHKELMVFLKEYVALNVPDQEGQTSLMKAALQGDVKLVQSLLTKGADPTMKDKVGCTALMHAAARGNTEVLRLLMKVDSISGRDHNGWTPLMHAASAGHVETVEVLLTSFTPDLHTWSTPRSEYINLQDKDGKNAVALAEEKKHKDVVQLINQCFH